MLTTNYKPRLQLHTNYKNYTATYRNYKNYNKELFENDIQTKLSEFDIENIPYETFTKILS